MKKTEKKYVNSHPQPERNGFAWRWNDSAITGQFRGAKEIKHPKVYKWR
jgi:hypothetical protein